MRPVSDKASADAWIMLACSIADRDPRTTGAGQSGRNGKNLHQNKCGEGYRPQEIACLSDHGRTMLALAGTSRLGSSPTEYKYRSQK